VVSVGPGRWQRGVDCSDLSRTAVVEYAAKDEKGHDDCGRGREDVGEESALAFFATPLQESQPLQYSRAGSKMNAMAGIWSSVALPAIVDEGLDVGMRSEEWRVVCSTRSGSQQLHAMGGPWLL
jgi:hypothetical protein